MYKVESDGRRRTPGYFRLERIREREKQSEETERCGSGGRSSAAPLQWKKKKRREELLLRTWCCGGHGGVADGVAVDDELDAAVALAAFGRVVGGHGICLAESLRGN